MTALDIIVLLLVGGAGFLGLMRGFVAEALSLIAWVLAVFMVKMCHGVVATMLTKPVGTEAGASVLAFAIIFGVTFFVGRRVAASIGESARKSVIGPLDRVLGLGFGALKGLIGATILFLMASLVIDVVKGGDADRPLWMTSSKSYPLLKASSTAMVDWVNTRRAKHKPTPVETPA
jgi:membrane protein required for colicin V production